LAVRTIAGRRFVIIFIASMLVFAGLVAILSIKLLRAAPDVTP
jgi:hypothetical protein